MSQLDPQKARILEITGDENQVTFAEAREKFFTHLKRCLEFPCLVTGIEDFRWEERYVIGNGDREEYKLLCKTRPSYRDIFELLRLRIGGVDTTWIMFERKDIAVCVRRKSDGKLFYLGLSELVAVDKSSKNYQLINDYGTWFGSNV